MSSNDQFICARVFPRNCGAFLFNRSDVAHVETGGRNLFVIDFNFRILSEKYFVFFRFFCVFTAFGIYSVPATSVRNCRLFLSSLAYRRSIVLHCWHCDLEVGCWVPDMIVFYCAMPTNLLLTRSVDEINRNPIELDLSTFANIEEYFSSRRELTVVSLPSGSVVNSTKDGQQPSTSAQSEVPVSDSIAEAVKKRTDRKSKGFVLKKNIAAPQKKKVPPTKNVGFKGKIRSSERGGSPETSGDIEVTEAGEDVPPEPRIIIEEQIVIRPPIVVEQQSSSAQSNTVTRPNLVQSTVAIAPPSVIEPPNIIEIDQDAGQPAFANLVLDANHVLELNEFHDAINAVIRNLNQSSEEPAQQFEDIEASISEDFTEN